MTGRVVAEIERLAGTVAAEGTDPVRLVRLVGWCTGARRTADRLRRRLVARRDQLDGGDPASAAAFDAELAPVTDWPLGSVGAVFRRWAQAGVRVATVVDPAYPQRLREGWPDVDVPAFLAWRGTPPVDDGAVAVVGARRATGYGTGVAAWLAEAASTAGVRIVSGGAVGIDAAAHRAALEHAGGTTVVLGCGHAVRYPRPHAGPGGLFDRVLEHGGTLLSEQLPHAAAHAGNVRARNRIVAALADVVVVVEGTGRSGALVTATAAADRGVPVMAVPGDVRAPGSVAPHRLLAEGAAPCTSPADLLDALGRFAPAPEASRTPAAVTVLPDDVHALLAAAWPRPVPIDDLAVATGRPAASLLGALTRARVAGETADDSSGVRLRRAPAR